MSESESESNIPMTTSVLFLSSSCHIHSPTTADFNFNSLASLASLLANSSEAVNLRSNTGTCDLSIRVENRIFYCHRAVLAEESEYFHIMLNGQYKESSVSRVTIQEYVSAETFENILESIYSCCETVKITDDNVTNLLRVSTYLLMPAITRDCVDYILCNAHSLKVEDMLEIFVYACRFNMEEIMDFSLQVILNRFPVFSSNDSFLEIPFDELMLLLIEYKSMLHSVELPEWSEREVSFLDILVRWTCRSVPDRWKHIGELANMIDFGTICPNFLSFLVRKLKFDSSIERWNNKFLFETGFKNFLRTSNDKVTVDDILSSFKDKEFCERPPIHVFVERSNSISVYSINRLEPTWSLSLKFSISRELYYSAAHDYEDVYECPGFHDTFQCFSLTNDLSFVYCLRNSEFRQSFLACSSVDISLKSIDLTPPPKRLLTSDACGLKTNMYLYENSTWRITNPGDHFLCYDRERDEWLPVPQPRESYSNSTLVGDENLLYLIEGVNLRDGARSIVQVYDDRTYRGWFKLLAQKQPEFYQPSCCVLHGQMYVFDGRKMEILDPRAMEWRSVPIEEGPCYRSNSIIKREMEEAHRVSPIFLPFGLHYVGRDKPAEESRPLPIACITRRRQMLVYDNQLWLFPTAFMGHEPLIIYDVTSGKSFYDDSLGDAIRSECPGDFCINSVLLYPNATKG